MEFILGSKDYAKASSEAKDAMVKTGLDIVDGKPRYSTDEYWKGVVFAAQSEDSENY